jgi:alkylated DNA nucleotide flippase Atl1
MITFFLQGGNNLPYKKKTWEEKLKNSKNYPKIIRLQENTPCRKALEKMGAKIGDSVVIAPPIQVNEVMKHAPKGRLFTLAEICKKLAKKNGAQYCCTLTTGIFVSIVANAAEEMNTDIPYWRTIKNNGELNPKYPGGIEKQKELLEKEGHSFIKKGRKHIRYVVKDFEKKVITLE